MRRHDWLLVPLLAALVSQAAPLEVTFDAGGLSALRADGRDWLRSGVPAVTRLVALSGTQLSNRVVSQTYDATARALTQHYAWGSVTCAWEPRPTELRLSVTVANASTETLTEVGIVLLALAAPADNAKLGRPSFGLSEPPFVTAAGPRGAVVWARETDGRPLKIDLSPGSDRGVSVLHCRVQLGGDTVIVDNVTADRRLPPGASDGFVATVRLGPADSQPLDLADDLIATWRQQHPRSLDWSDHRPILRMFFGGGLSQEEAIARLKNPESATMPAPDPGFRKQVLGRMRNLIAAAREVDAQGAIMWDLEGTTFPHATTYIGDPRLIRLFNPQMELVIDEAMQMLKDAGLRVGVTLRPSHVAYNPQKQTAAHSHTDAKDPFLELDTKIAYIRQRWGCTLVYIDTNFFWRQYGPTQTWKAGPIAADVWQRLHAKYPDVLLIPELPTVADYQATVPYGEADMGDWGTPNLMRRIWPDAWRVIAIEDADPVEYHDRFVACARQGNALMTYAYSPNLVYVVAMKHILQEVRLLDVGMPAAVSRVAPAGLVPLLTSPELSSRYFAARRLAQTPVQAAADALRQRAADAQEDWLVRRQALLAMAKVTVPVALWKLPKEQPTPLDVPQMASAGKVALPELQTLLLDRNLGLWHAAAQAIAGQGSAVAAEAVLPLLLTEIQQAKPDLRKVDALATVLRLAGAVDQLKVAAEAAAVAGQSQLGERLTKH